MSIWGKLLGGAAGLALGGPLGALIGAIAGHAVDQMRREDRAPPDATRSVGFTIAVIVLGAKLAKADGRVTRDEIAAFKEVFQVPPDELKNVARVFDMARRDSNGFEPYAHQVAAMFRDNPAVLEKLLYCLAHIAQADGAVHPEEERYLRKVAEIMGLDDAAFARATAIHTRSSGEDPYRVLGLNPSVSDAELRRAYRDLVRENHPDRLTAQGMPQEFIEVANRKLAEINAAYDRIAAQRGLT
ncbi:MAG: TerB family tellurite resistance protein [Alphaproteobacteria bacterium]